MTCLKQQIIATRTSRLDTTWHVYPEVYRSQHAWDNSADRSRIKQNWAQNHNALDMSYETQAQKYSTPKRANSPLRALTSHATEVLEWIKQHPAEYQRAYDEQLQKLENRIKEIAMRMALELQQAKQQEQHFKLPKWILCFKSDTGKSSKNEPNINFRTFIANLGIARAYSSAEPEAIGRYRFDSGTASKNLTSAGGKSNSNNFASICSNKSCCQPEYYCDPDCTTKTVTSSHQPYLPPFRLKNVV